MQKKIMAVGIALAMFASATPAFAAVNSTRITINTTNRGTISNITTADSHTGLNTALGSQGGAGAAGGNVTSAGNENNGGAIAGNGGNGGNGGAGGLVQTGDATSEAGTVNDLNNTDAEVALDCDCGDINSVTIELDTDNDDIANNVANLTDARSRTGDNTALGSLGGDAGIGGNVDGGIGDENNGGARAGSGGAGGAGGLGGTIGTGHASSTSGTINMLNTVMLRVRL
jgi:hypothetical protein